MGKKQQRYGSTWDSADPFALGATGSPDPLGADGQWQGPGFHSPAQQLRKRILQKRLCGIGALGKSENLQRNILMFVQVSEFPAGFCWFSQRILGNTLWSSCWLNYHTSQKWKKKLWFSIIYHRDVVFGGCCDSPGCRCTSYVHINIHMCNLIMHVYTCIYIYIDIYIYIHLMDTYYMYIYMYVYVYIFYTHLHSKSSLKAPSFATPTSSVTRPMTCPQSVVLQGSWTWLKWELFWA